MNIRHRLALSFSAILVLFAINLAIFSWSTRLRTRSTDALSRALTRQVIIGSLRHDLDNLSKQVALLSQLPAQDLAAGATSDAREAFARSLDEVRGKIQQLRALSEPTSRTSVDEMANTFALLAGSWQGFYQSAGISYDAAMAQLIRADPLVRRLLTVQLPRLEETEKEREREAEEDFGRVARLTQQTNLAIFGLSVLLGIWVAYRVSRHITDNVSELTRGAALLGSGVMDYRIDVGTQDELGELGNAFNDMADHLVAAQRNLMGAKEELENRAAEVANQKQLSEELLLNILPNQVAQELREKGSVDPMYFEDVTIVFTDFVGFTLSTEKLAAEELVSMLHEYFTAFDQIVARYHLEKLKTIGDSYMCVSGLPVGRRRRRTPSHPVDAVLAAFEMVQTVREREQTQAKALWSVRVGVHTGPVVAGVVGIQKFAFDVWGESVNYASRMESSGSPNRINLSAATFARVKDFFHCEHRGKVMTKEKREYDMWFADGLLPELMDASGQVPPPAFVRRYRVYFQKEPPAFPAFLVRPSDAETPPVIKLEAYGS